MSRPTKAVTLIELTVAMALTLMMVGMLYMVLQLGMRLHAHNRVRSEMLKETGAAVARLAKDMLNTRADTVGFGPDHIWFLSAEPGEPASALFQYGPAGQLVWQKRYCYYYEPSIRELIRSEIALDTPTENTQPPPEPLPNLTDFQAVTGAGSKTMARDIELFRVEENPDEPIYEVRVAASREVGSGKATQIELRTRVMGRNL